MPEFSLKTNLKRKKGRSWAFSLNLSSVGAMGAFGVVAVVLGSDSGIGV